MRNMASADTTALAGVNGAASSNPAAAPSAAGRAESGACLILTFDTMIPVGNPEAIPGYAIRGVSGGGLPWLIEAGTGSLSRDGHLRVRIRGLVLAGHSSVPVSLRGVNPFPAFRLVVSGLRVGPDGVASIANVSTGDFEASPGGDCDIDARVALPRPCLAPIVLVTGPNGAETWLAATGS